MAKSIGDLHAKLTADISQYEASMNKASKLTKGMSESVAKETSKLAMGALGAGSAIALITNELRHVIANIDNIPGIPAEAIASVNDWKTSIAGARNEVDKLIAKGLAFAGQAAQAVGAGAAMILGYDDTSSLSKGPTPTELAQAKDPGYDGKVAAAREEMVKAEKQAELAAMSRSDRISKLMADAEQLRQISKKEYETSLSSLQHQSQAYTMEAQASKELADMKKELATAEEKLSAAMTGTYRATVSQEEAIEGLEARSMSLMHKLGDLSVQDQNSPRVIEEKIKLTKELAVVQAGLGKLYEKAGEISRKAGDVIASSFEDAIFEARSLGEAVEALAMNLLKLVFNQMITTPLASMISGGISGMLGIPVPGHAGGGSVGAGSLSLVGERGPELFVPGASGAIIPAMATRSAMAGGMGNQVLIDARGADAGAVSRLEALFQGMNLTFNDRVSAVVRNNMTRRRL
jgi:hypothetical protein